MVESVGVKQMETLRLVTMAKTFDKALNVRTTAAAQQAIDSVDHRVRWLPSLVWRGGRPTKEAVVNASWLYLSELSNEELEAIFVKYLPKLEALIAARQAKNKVAGSRRSLGAPIPPPDEMPAPPIAESRRNVIRPKKKPGA
jgi:hypothetical protein